MLSKWVRTEVQREQRLRELERKAAKMKEESELLTSRIEGLRLSDPPDNLCACAAYLWGCSEREVAPSYQDAHTQGYRVHAAALQSVINDAVSSGQVRALPEGRILCLGGTELHRLAMLRRQNSK